jgi:hypothetical protein
MRIPRSLANRRKTGIKTVLIFSHAPPSIKTVLMGEIGGPGMDGYEASTGRGELVVSIGSDGAALGVRLSPAVMDLPAEELAMRIVRLHTLAHLRFQLAVDQRVRSDDGDRCAPRSAMQVAAYARTIDF